MTKLITAGSGPGDKNLITLSVLDEIKNSDLVLMPRSNIEQPGIAEKIFLSHIPDLKFFPVLFPMIHDEKKRDEIIRLQIFDLTSEWKNSKKIFFPIIGDSTLYSTGAYLYKIFLEFIPDLELELIPGISAHSLAASCAKRFIAMGDEIFSIIPGTAEPEKIISILEISDSAAIYKPTAIRKEISEIIKKTGPWKEIIRVDHAGMIDEKIFHKNDALENIFEYLSILLLWKKKKEKK